jgi:2'-5' RNA ligase
MSLVIAAIPREDDPIWKISSEKVPHITILFLGDGDNPNRGHIAQFLEHAANTSLKRFELNVDRRGEIGEDKADVLFFGDRWQLPQLRDFRAQLLQDNTIKTAYDSTAQFPIWIPHLTLGYPKAPAKPTERPISYIEFDRLALWEGNYEGVEVVLKDYYFDEVSMNDTEKKGLEFLEHYGKKGMKWGQRMEARKSKAAAANAVKNAPKDVTINTQLKRNKYKTKAEGGQKQPVADDAVKAYTSRQKLKKSGVDSLSNKELQELSTRMNLEVQVNRLDKETQSSGKKFVNKLVEPPKPQEVRRIAIDNAKKQQKK